MRLSAVRASRRRCEVLGARERIFTKCKVFLITVMIAQAQTDGRLSKNFPYIRQNHRRFCKYPRKMRYIIALTARSDNIIIILTRSYTPEVLHGSYARLTGLLPAYNTIKKAKVPKMYK